MSDVFEVAGLVFLSVAAFMVSVTLGVAAVGVSCLLVGFAFDGRDDE